MLVPAALTQTVTVLTSWWLVLLPGSFCVSLSNKLNVTKKGLSTNTRQTHVKTNTHTEHMQIQTHTPCLP